MPLVEAISWTNAAADQIAMRFPNVSLKFGSQVIVMENQWAVFFRDGKALDVFGPGRHTISSNNIPLLTGLVQRIGLIGNIFECEVIFITNSQLRANFGGQAYSAPSGQIQYQAEIGFFGYLLYKVEDPLVYLLLSSSEIETLVLQQTLRTMCEVLSLKGSLMLSQNMT